MKPNLLVPSVGMLLALAGYALGQPAGVLDDETKVPAYTLPATLVCADGNRVTNARDWREKRRPELLRLFETEIYGRAPGRPDWMSFRTVALVTNALGGLATRREIEIRFSRQHSNQAIQLLLYVPNAARQPAPAFLGLSFNGNHAITTESDVQLSNRWMSERNGCTTNHRATVACRGVETSRWPVEKILKRGYALATAYYGDLEPDFAEGWKTGVRSLPLSELSGEVSTRETNATIQPADWGAISAWAWGLSRALDYLETNPAVDSERVAVIGHSRLGKTSLWAGAFASWAAP